MIIDDHSRMIVGGEIFYNDNAYNFQKVLKRAVEIRFLPDDMDRAYILYEGIHYPITATDKVTNSNTRRNNSFPIIQY